MSALQLTTFDSADRLPVLNLSPDNSNPSSYLEADVALVWPYSSSSATLALLLVDTDTKPGQVRGQVKVVFRHGCARQVANTKVGIGDTLRLGLNDCAWKETGDVISTPGKKLAWDLEYTSRVCAQISRDGQDSINVDYKRSNSEEPVATTVPLPLPALSHVSTPVSTPTSNGLRRPPTDTISVPYFSPAKSIRRSSGATFLDGFLEPSAGEDDYITGRGRKRTKFARQSGTWNLIDSDDDQPQTQTTVNHDDSSRREGISTPEDAHVPLSQDQVSSAHVSSPVQQPPSIMGPPQTPAKTLHLTPPQPPEAPSPSKDSDKATTPRLMPLASPGLPLVSPLIHRTGVEFGYFPTFQDNMSQLDASAKESVPSADDLPGNEPVSKGSPDLEPHLAQPDEQAYIAPSSSLDNIPPSPHDALTTSNLNTTEPEADPYFVPDHWLSTLEANIVQELQQNDQMSPAPVTQEAPVTVEIESDDLYGPPPSLPDKAPDADQEPVLEEQMTNHENSPVLSTVLPKNEIPEKTTSVHEDSSDAESPPVLSVSASSTPERSPSPQTEKLSKSPEPVHVITSDEDSEADTDTGESDEPATPESEEAGQADAQQESEPASESDDEIEVTAVVRHDEPDYPETESSPLASTSPKVSFIETVLTELDERSAQVDASDAVDTADTYDEAENDAEVDLTVQDLQKERSPSKEPTQPLSPDVTAPGIPDESSPKPQLPEVSDSARSPMTTSILPTPDQTQDDKSRSHEDLVSTALQPEQGVLLPSPIPTQDTQETVTAAKDASLPDSLPDQSEPNLESTAMQPNPPQRPLRHPIKPKNISSPFFTPRRSARLSSPEARRDKGSPSSPLQTTFPTSPVLESQENDVIAASPVLPTTETFHSSEKGLITPIAYYVHLISLQEHFGQVIDAIVVCSDSAKADRAKSGPKDYFLNIHVVDQTYSTPVLVQIFRPVKNSLPSLNPGDAIILRSFKVQTVRGNFSLLSTDTSAWAVSPKGSSQLIIAGPPIEHGLAEVSYASSLVEWWQKDSALEEPEHIPASTGPQTRSSRRVNTSPETLAKPKPTPISVSRRKANMTDNFGNSSDHGHEEAVENDHDVQSPLLEKQHDHRGSTTPTTATVEFAPRRSARHRKSPSVVHELRDGTKYVDDENSTPAKRGGSVVHELRDGARYIDE
ncbi:hypothetical protein PV10_06590 [Exophiala mesophila]|uniref:Telomeric single stranded DNA binding POT1/Cdc13 domain-containing protein n=1 Tax=Exophiala mesophila TaxID=212818 RepID=A0A0D1WSG7_EXOME|nr:uncharacterized protein PV10_06590 [Exophiala mesophila]KIV92125.1 hypothetical protein PV10_06590 [Exophiala mesophila]